ncbi:MAG: hypothetical protein PHQ27_08895 [Victivallales bacterium]|nr:hypothetical protein [Victivallales bacterium]
MSFGKVTIITVDDSQTVCILKASLSDKKGLAVTEFLTEDGSGDNLSLVFGRLKKTIKGSGSALVIFAAAIRNSVTFDLQMPLLPVKDVNNAIRMELPRYIPLADAEVEFSSRFVAVGSERQILRVNAWPAGGRRKYEELLAANNINIDVWMDPFQAPDPAVAKDVVCLPTFDRDFALAAPDEKGMRQFLPVEPGMADDCFCALCREVTTAGDREEMGAEFAPALLLAHYAFHGTFRHDAKIMVMPPKKLRIKRYFAIKAILIVLVAVNLAAAVTMVLRVNYARYRQYSGYHSKVAELQRKIKITSKELKLLKQESRNVNKIIDDASRELPLCDLLHDLAKASPAEVQLDRFSLSNGTLNLSFSGGQTVEALQSSIENIKYIKVESAQRRNWRNVRYMLMLRLKRAENNSGNRNGNGNGNGNGK